jgi:glycosyltransferase involved in cell wall biosynthesis
VARTTGEQQNGSNRATPSPVRVLLVSQPTITGAAYHVWQLAKRLDRSRFRVTVACPEGGWLKGAVLESGADYRRLDLAREIRPLRDLLAAISLLRIIFQVRPHVLHLHASKAGFLGRVLHPLHDVPIVIYTPHGLAYRHFKGWQQRLYLQLERLAGRFGSYMVCVSESERKAALTSHLCQRSKVGVIPNGVELPAPARAATHRLHSLLGLPAECLVVAMLARLEVPKRPQDLVEAAALLGRTPGTLRIVFMGDGPLQASVDRLARSMHVDDMVACMGYRHDAASLIDDVDVIVLASDVEGMPFSLLEGMAAQKPVVGTDVAGIYDLIEDGVDGFLYPAGAAGELAEALTMLLENPRLRTRLGERGRERVEANHRARSMVSSNAGLYLHLLEGLAPFR